LIATPYISQCKCYLLGWFKLGYVVQLGGTNST